MKVTDLFETEDDDFPTAKLKDLSKHAYNGRIWVGPEQAEKAINVVHDAADDDTPIWHDWMNEQGTVYEVSFSTTTKAALMKIIDAVKSAFPRPPHCFWCHKPHGGTIKHSDWLGI